VEERQSRGCELKRPGQEDGQAAAGLLDALCLLGWYLCRHSGRQCDLICFRCCMHAQTPKPGSNAPLTVPPSPCSCPCLALPALPCSPPGTDTRGLVGQSRCQVKRPQVKRLSKL